MFYFRGYTTTVRSETETWNGVSWAETTDMNTARQAGGSAGTQSGGGLAFAGTTGSISVASEEWSALVIQLKQ